MLDADGDFDFPSDHDDARSGFLPPDFTLVNSFTEFDSPAQAVGFSADGEMWAAGGDQGWVEVVSIRVMPDRADACVCFTRSEEAESCLVTVTGKYDSSTHLFAPPPIYPWKRQSHRFQPKRLTPHQSPRPCICRRGVSRCCPQLCDGCSWWRKCCCCECSSLEWIGQCCSCWTDGQPDRSCTQVWLWRHDQNRRPEGLLPVRAGLSHCNHVQT